LTELCARHGVAFDEAMLSWPPGPKPEDGIWAPHWYGGVHRSTGWEPYRRKQVRLDPAVAPVLDEAMPLYERLMAHRVGSS
jgi:hypothetical protein